MWLVGGSEGFFSTIRRGMIGTTHIFGMCQTGSSEAPSLSSLVSCAWPPRLTLLALQTMLEHTQDEDFPQGVVATWESPMTSETPTSVMLFFLVVSVGAKIVLQNFRWCFVCDFRKWCVHSNKGVDLVCLANMYYDMCWFHVCFEVTKSTYTCRHMHCMHISISGLKPCISHTTRGIMIWTDLCVFYGLKPQPTKYPTVLLYLHNISILSFSYTLLLYM